MHNKVCQQWHTLFISRLYTKRLNAAFVKCKVVILLKMKNLKHIVLFAALIAIAVGCVKKVEVSFATSEVSVAPEGGAVEAVLTSNGDWTVASYPYWLTVSPASGNGNATLVLSAEANLEGESRSGQVVVSTKDNRAVLAVNQGFNDMMFLTITPETLECIPEGGVFEVAVTSNCSWEVGELPQWMTCSPMSGTGNDSLVVTIEGIGNDPTEGREWDVQIGNAAVSATLHVTQNGVVVYGIVVDPDHFAVGFDGDAQMVTVQCSEPWNARNETDWIRMDAVSGEGPTTLVIKVLSNMEYIPRVGIVHFSTRSGAETDLVVNQEAAPNPHFLTLSLSEVNFSGEGGTAEIAVECDETWRANVDCNWVTVSPQSGSENGTLMLQVGHNVLASERSAQLTVSSDNLVAVATIHQDGSGVQVMIDLQPDTVFISSEGGVGTIELTANVPWTLSSANWVNLLQTSGTGNATVGLYVDKNPTAFDRAAFVYGKYNNEICDQIVVFQPARIPYLEANMTQIIAPLDGGVFVIDISSNQSWMVNKGESWLHFSPDSGHGDGQLVINVDALQGAQPRSTQVHVNGLEDGSTVVITIKQGY